MMPKSIVLIGFTSTGKSATGRMLAERCGMEFCDLDTELVEWYTAEHSTRRTCREIFKEHGETFFRQLEADTLRALQGRDGMVLATGGGAPMTEANQPLINALGCVIYLKASPKTVIGRMKRKGFPAFLASDPSLENLTAIMTARDPVYTEIADMIIDTSALELRQSVQAIIKQMCAL